MKYPIKMLNISYLFFILLPFYYLIFFPVSIILNIFDLCLNHKTGTGLLVYRQKTRKVKLSLYIAKRYLFAKKSRNAINIISAVSVAGVAVGTMALIIILSVFNGLETMVSHIFNTFDPDIKITASEVKHLFRTQSV